MTDMLYKELCDHYVRLEATTKRSEMIDVLKDLLQSIDPKDSEMVIRLTKGEVAPGYEGIELGIAEKLLLRSIYMVTMIPEKEINDIRIQKGDIGDAAETLVARKKQQSLFSEELTIERVFDNMMKISSKEGKASQDHKMKLIAELLHDADPIEAKYLSRMLCQKMRLGSADMTIIDSLSYLVTDGFHELHQKAQDIDIEIIDGDLLEGLRQHSFTSLNDLISIKGISNIDDDKKEAFRNLKEEASMLKSRIKEIREKIVRSYNIHPDLPSIVKKILQEGIQDIEDIVVTPGVPLRSMLGERLKSIDEIIEKLGGEAAFEYKYDGLRIQAHKMKDGTIRLFSRQLEDITDQFPDVVKNISRIVASETAIIEGECVPVDTNTGEMLPFQVISRRRGRKHDLQSTIDDVPVNLVVFDCLFADGFSMIDRPYLERRDMVKNVLPGIGEDLNPEKGISLSRMKIIRDPKEGISFFEGSLEDGSEGIMAKSTDAESTYQAGSRGWNWIKFKKDYRSELNDTLDLVVIGGFHGSGRRGGTYGAFLMAVYDEEEHIFRTICKLGSGFNDQQLQDLYNELKENTISKDQMKAVVDVKLEPDVYFQPKMVFETIGAEISFSPVHTCGWSKMKTDHGLALRFPRFTGRFRDDKSPRQATTVNEILSMYKSQTKRS